MLYPKEDRAARKLMFACRNCDFIEDAQGTCVFRHVITRVPIEQTLVSIDLSSDPTFPRSKTMCPQCGHMEAVFFQSRSKGKDANMKLFFACCSCNHRWTQDTPGTQA
ncbi:DNA-directed RNA polymerase II subunit RPB9 [Polyrhizophydium stewartii]|uniref:DNA-directed RNA polymerase subunit n=1 Tax=Polyrhizophydium stewartii TaxID=2732419 RepID=A0ABR4NG16_9FUNG